MHNDNWAHGMNGGGWWIVMALMMTVFWAGLIWLGITLLRRSNHPTQPPTTTAPPSAMASRPSARDILDERFARGEIEIDDYRQRAETLIEGSKPSSSIDRPPGLMNRTAVHSSQGCVLA